MQVHYQLCALFLPSLERQHYLFNLRHIAGLFRYTCMSTPPIYYAPCFECFCTNTVSMCVQNFAIYNVCVLSSFLPNRQLCLQCSAEVTPRDLLLMWERESWWTYSGVLSSEVDRERYWEVITHALRKHFSQSDLVSETWSFNTKPLGTACVYLSYTHICTSSKTNLLVMCNLTLSLYLAF